MSSANLGPVEARFADLIWDNAPLSSGQLVKLAAEELTWKKSTTYTVLRRLCDRGLFQNSGGLVTVLVSREDFYAMQSRQFVEDTFRGSLPGFLAAFTQRKRLSDADLDALQQLIDEHRR